MQISKASELQWPFLKISGREAVVGVEEGNWGGRGRGSNAVVDDLHHSGIMFRL